MAGRYTPATIGAEAAPPTFAIDPVATKKSGARSSFAARNRRTMWTASHTTPIKR